MNAFFENFKVLFHVLKRFTIAVTGLILLSWQAVVTVSAAGHTAIESDAPPLLSTFQSQPQRLEAELRRHLAWANAGGWPRVPDGPTIRPGAADPRLAILAQRLAVSGDLSDDIRPVSTSEYDEVLENAVRRFQERHALEVDGLVGHATLRALNVSTERRIDQIRLNIERMRRLLDGPMGNLLVVNTAAFKAYVVRDGTIVWTAKVIVGETQDETPEFRSEMKYMVFNPSWSIPHSIASEEMLPKIKRDPGFFRTGGYELYDREGKPVDPAAVEWSTVSTGDFPYTLVQRPGPQNQMGELKFMFPNEYAVCMHDTPARALFEKAARAFSHGCIRVQEPRALAEVILDPDGWTRQRIDLQIESGETTSVTLSEPLPVYVLYWTAEVDDSGRLRFHPDLYDRDGEAFRAMH